MRRTTPPLIVLVLVLFAGSLSASAAPPALPQPLDAVVPTTGASVEPTGMARIDRVGESIVALTDGANRVGSGIVVAPDLVLTSLNVVSDRVAPMIMVKDVFVPYRVVVQDDTLKLALLSADLPDMRPVTWGEAGGLRKGDAVFALGLPEAVRDVIRLDGLVKAPAIAMMGPILTTDIPVDPLVEGGALVDAKGKTVGVIVSQGFGLADQQLGVAVTSEEGRALVERVTKSKEAEAAAAAARARWRWVPRLVLALIVGAVVAFFVWFGRWYRQMEQRESAGDATVAEPVSPSESATRA